MYFAETKLGPNPEPAETSTTTEEAIRELPGDRDRPGDGLPDGPAAGDVAPHRHGDAHLGRSGVHVHN